MKIKDTVWIIKATFQEWSEHKAARLAAALSYYTLFSLAPLLIIAIAVAGMLWGNQQAAQQQILNQVASLVGKQGADAIQSMIVNARNTGSSVLATIIGLVTLLLGATGLFGELHDSLNTIWEVKKKRSGGILGLLRDRLLSFTMVLGTGFLLLVSLVLDAVLSRLGTYAAGALPGSALLWQAINLLVSLGVVTLLFAMIYRVLPDVQIAWSDVWLGAAVTALLFAIGKFALGIYLGNATFASTYGAAGSLVIILVWVYYSAQILFFGAEFTQVYANRFGTHLEPEPGAEFVTEQERARQGIPHEDSTPDVKKAQEIKVAPVYYNSARQATSSPLAAGQQLLPEAQPSMIALSAIVASLVGFVSGWVFKRSGKPKRGRGA